MSRPVSKWARLVLICSVVGLLLAGCGSRAMAAPVAHVRWHACPGGQCGSLAVPLDYRHPDGKTINLALFRLPATDPSHRIGSLLFNPGGPGASGIKFLRSAGLGFPDKLRAHFDLVTWDPRGTGASDPIDCGSALAAELGVDGVPVTSKGRASLVAEDETFGRACKARMGAILGNVATVDTARDLDRIRASLGDRKLSYVGYSYGTYLGAVYANMFPGHVRAMILDGVQDPAVPYLDSLLAQAKSVESSLDRVLAACAKTPSCPFFNGGHPGAAFDALAKRIEEHPIAAAGRVLGTNQFYFGTADPLYNDDQKALTTALAAAQAGHAAPMLRLFDDYVGRQANGTYSTEQSANQAINCLDGQSVGQLASVERLAPSFVAAAPRFGRFLIDGALTCGYWPEKARPPAVPTKAVGAPPIVVIGTTGDPATPYHNSVTLAHELHSGVLLRNVGATHTSQFGLGGNCDSLGISYLLTLTVPANGTTCSGAVPAK